MIWGRRQKYCGWPKETQLVNIVFVGAFLYSCSSVSWDIYETIFILLTGSNNWFLNYKSWIFMHFSTNQTLFDEKPTMTCSHRAKNSWKLEFVVLQLFAGSDDQDNYRFLNIFWKRLCMKIGMLLRKLLKSIVKIYLTCSYNYSSKISPKASDYQHNSLFLQH